MGENFFLVGNTGDDSSGHAQGHVTYSEEV